MIRELIDIQYERNEMDFHRGTFRVRGDVLEIIPAEESDTAVRVEFFGDEIDRISQIDTLTGEIKADLKYVAIAPASHYVVPMDTILRLPRKSKRSWRSVSAGLRARISCWRLSGSRNGPILILRCCGRRESAPALRIIPATCRGWSRASRLTR